MAEITVSLGMTKNTGNFENVRLDIQVKDETRVIEGKLETVSQATDRIYALVERKLNEKMAEALGDNDKE